MMPTFQTLAICVIFITAFAGVVKSEGPKEIVDKVNAGVTAGQAIVSLFTNSTFPKAIAGLATKIGPFLGAIGPMMSLLSQFLSASPSAELELMKTKFAEIDAKFDRVFEQFVEVKNLISETSLKSQYGKHEQTIVGLSYQLKRIMNSSAHSVRSQMDSFVVSYESTFGNSAYILWRGMVSKMVFNGNIPKTAMSYTNYDRKRVQKIMEGVTQLIMQGVKVHLAYWKVTGKNGSEEEKNEWELKLKQLFNHINDVDTTVMNAYLDQSEKDIGNLAANNQGASHSSFADTVYNFLVKKYYWRDWFVVVYDDISGDSKHMVKSCGGHKLFGKHGFNIVTASKDALAPKANLLTAKSYFERLNDQAPILSIDYFYSADAFYRFIPTSIRNGCNYASVVVITNYGYPAYKAAPGRFVKVVKRYYVLSAFG